MANTAVTAEGWTRFLASRTYVPCGALLLKHFESGTITRLCDCGCNSYDLAVPANGDLEPLMATSDRSGAVLMLAFYVRDNSEPKRTVEITVFANRDGYLSGVDVDFCGNSMPMPESIEIVEPPFQVAGTLAA